ncbi:hypothetical protein ONZ43_g6262 [Nemania bipapillata]|uniref:Uncharacterized protein n=1 Tax=Nemania bipapillata TaxID=110536 RepID=A0ACC2I1I5_9PEZI|nr:hypothetical protein ONZ43_g6262 [Nemania bipapillata]
MWVLWVFTGLRADFKSAARTEEHRQRKMEKIMQEDRGYVPGIRGGRGTSRPVPPPRRPSSPAAAVSATPAATAGQAAAGSGGASGRRHNPDGDEILAQPPAAVLPEDMPSPPYTPGPHYEAHMANVQQRRQQQQHQQQQQSPKEEMEDLKEALDNAPIMPASPDEMHRGQV